MNAQVSVGPVVIDSLELEFQALFFNPLDVGVGTELGSSAEYVAPTS